MIQDEFRREIFCACTGATSVSKDGSIAYVRFLFEYYFDRIGGPETIVYYACLINSPHWRLPEKEYEEIVEYLDNLRILLNALYFLCLTWYATDPTLSLKLIEHRERFPKSYSQEFVQRYKQEEALRLLQKIPVILCLHKERVSVQVCKILFECEGIASLLKVAYEWNGTVQETGNATQGD